MGLTYQDARQLIKAMASGARFDSVVTIGRQSTYLGQNAVTALCREFGLAGGAWTHARPGDVADSFFRDVLQTSRLEAIDISPYEGARILHDMNDLLPSHLFEQFDAVYDGGSIEHIFNVPVALANLMHLARVGGAVFMATPSNNLSGHGFYQFSPELVYRVFTPDRGFRLREVAIFEYGSPDVERKPAVGAWRVVDPADVGQRVGLMSRRAAILWVQAEKIAHVEEPFAVAPQQTDYVAAWRGERTKPIAGQLKGRVRAAVPPSFVARWRVFEKRRRYSTRNRRFYSRLSK